MQKQNEKEKSEVPALEASIKILEYLSRYKSKERSLSQIAKNLSINKSTCHRILKLFIHYRYVSYNEDSKQYNLGPYLLVLGTRASEFIDYLRLAKPYLKSVCEQTRLTSVLLEPLSNDRLMYVAKEELDSPDDPVQVTVKIGQHFPVTSASFGKCYLAFLEAERTREMIQKVNFKQFTDSSITDFEIFQESLNEVKQKGYAVSYEEHTPGIVGVAAPIFDHNGEIKMVIACIGFASKISEEQISFCGEMLKEASKRIMEVIGGREP
ncbi:IclR family transcriptional regulator [Neobacillus sp. OS1-2]|uniref:IclR family transcriptional regulator n=1 Tax=Neobacillus sp. OS1-2 TaxID=3070680 RepID=UPI0027E03AA1|nr:IclR family transcriptional regulator [Neobacillus sp. OS1-2]WML37953.1 IclR family transcriptional regulator [Neobacillus sp. OS1-2]